MSQCPGGGGGGVLQLCFPEGSGASCPHSEIEAMAWYPGTPPTAPRGPLTWSMYTAVMAPEWPCRVKRQHESSRRNTWGRGGHQVLVSGGFPVTFWPGHPSSASSPWLTPHAGHPGLGHPSPHKTEPTLTLSVWSWLPVTSRPAAAFRAVMGFWCAQGTVWVRRQATVSLLLYTGDVGELLRPGVPGDDRPSMDL